MKVNQTHAVALTLTGLLVLVAILVLELMHLSAQLAEHQARKQAAVETQKAIVEALRARQTEVTVKLRAVRTAPEKFEVTAYSQRAEENTADGITFTGLPVDIGIAATDPSVIPLGSVIWVEGYGYAFVADIGGAIKGKRVDVFFHCTREALEFGRQMRKVKVIALPMYEPQ